MPREYTLGDEIRLEVEVVWGANVQSMRATFFREEHELIKKSPEYSYAQGAFPASITLEGDAELVDSEPPHPTIPQVPSKTYRAELVTLVDIDHGTGLYTLGAIALGTPLGDQYVVYCEDESNPLLPKSPNAPTLEPVQFRIMSQPPHPKRITARLMDDPASE
jgi:hypothetical protein